MNCCETKIHGYRNNLTIRPTARDNRKNNGIGNFKWLFPDGLAYIIPGWTGRNITVLAESSNKMPNFKGMQYTRLITVIKGGSPSRSICMALVPALYLPFKTQILDGHSYKFGKISLLIFTTALQSRRGCGWSVSNRRFFSSIAKKLKDFELSKQKCRTLIMTGEDI